MILKKNSYVNLLHNTLVYLQRNKIKKGEAENALKTKYEVWVDEVEGQNYYYYYEERVSYGEFAGSYAQDAEGLSDNFINEVLEGDPDVYWNID